MLRLDEALQQVPAHILGKGYSDWARVIVLQPWERWERRDSVAEAVKRVKRIGWKC